MKLILFFRKFGALGLPIGASRIPLAPLLFTLFYFHLSAGQSLSKNRIERLADATFKEAVFDLNSFLEIPNDGHFEDQVEQNLRYCQRLFSNIGFTTRTIDTQGAPLLFAEKKVDPDLPTLLFYLQIDGQPVDTTAWIQPDPFRPVLKERDDDGSWQIIPWSRMEGPIDVDWRIFARSASDSKGPAMAFISALELLEKQKHSARHNIKVIMDFQEEMGSPHLADAVSRNRSLLQADMILIMDGTRHLSNLPTLTYGARGIATATLTVFGPRSALHSGQYGNFAPNPVFGMAKLLAGLKDEDGRVLLPGFYDGIRLNDREKALLEKVPENKDSLLGRLGIARADAVGDNYQEALQYPSLNIRGLKAAWVGDEVRTLIPSEAIAEIDMRLVPESDGTRLMESLKTYVQAQGYHLVDSLPTDAERSRFPKLASLRYRLGSRPFRTPMDSHIGDFLTRALNKVFGERIVHMRTTGGSQPIAPFIETLDIPAVSIRIPNPDNSIHAPNENLRLGNYWEGIVTCIALLDEPFTR